MPVAATGRRRRPAPVRSRAASSNRRPRPNRPSQPPPRASYDPDILRKLVILDPESGAKIVSAFNALDEGQIKQHQAQNDLDSGAQGQADKPPVTVIHLTGLKVSNHYLP
jgi:hypothetical protein